MSSGTQIIDRILEQRQAAFAAIERIITPEAYFAIFQQLSDNYSPTMTVSRVQGPLVEQLIANGAGDLQRLTVDRNARHSGTITVKVGTGKPAVWFSAHSDICSFLTGPWDGTGYPLTPFCMPATSPGGRPAMALAAPDGAGPLERLAEGTMVTLEDRSVRFECDRDDLPLQTRVVHHLAADWNRESGRVTGFLDNQAGSAALLLIAQALSHTDANVLCLLNDEEEGPVDKGNQGFSRAANRLMHRTPLDELPDYMVVSDGHGQSHALESNGKTLFGQGATFSGVSSQARGAVTPPQLLTFKRALAERLAPRGIKLLETSGYVGRSDDISAMQFTPNVSIIGYPNAYAHFEKPPISQISDLVNLTKTLAVVGLVAQDEEWRQHYL